MDNLKTVNGLEEFIKKTIWGLVCQNCNGTGCSEGGRTCLICEGCGISEWRIDSFQDLMKAQARFTRDEILNRISKIHKIEMTFSDIKEALN
jgi:RecJ-like exonuclease